MLDPADPNLRDALAAALRFLARRDRLAAEVRAELEAKGFPRPAVAEAIAELRRQRILDDARVIELVVDARPVDSRQMLRQRLLARGADPDLLEESLAAVDDSERARAALSTRAWSQSEPIKAARFLANKGFEEDLVQSLIEQRFGEL